MESTHRKSDFTNANCLNGVTTVHNCLNRFTTAKNVQMGSQLFITV
jgi:hypothetical protein